MAIKTLAFKIIWAYKATRLEKYADEIATMKLKDIVTSFGKPLGAGKGRIVIPAGDVVIKRAKNSFGINQNENEWDVYDQASAKTRKILAPALAISENGKVLIMKRADKSRVSKSDMKKLGLKDVTIVEDNLFGELEEPEQMQMFVGPQWNDFDNWPYVGIGRTDKGEVAMGGDFLRPSSWGKINGKPVLIDYGY